VIQKFASRYTIGRGWCEVLFIDVWMNK
jgi:hypothetical protein